ncbi:MAG: hypothetical protein A4E49_00460 [Methanosaeta sp. PtaU1.Bin112]|nr:MAG: hypothetical protein A4E49_00460 [Methanosaeta sp. PtaU1.Bin112]
MTKLANAALNSFASHPTQNGFESIEIPVSEFQNVLKDCIEVYNQLAEMLRDCGIIRGKELARLTGKAQDSLKTARSPVEKILLINAYIKQLLARIRDALKTATPAKRGIIRQAITKIQLRAEALVNHIRVLAEGKEKVSLSSPQARQYLAGMEGEPVSRRDCIRALHRAERICPALECGHLGDGRRTARLTARAEDILSVPFGNGHLGAYS